VHSREGVTGGNRSAADLAPHRSASRAVPPAMWFPVVVFGWVLLVAVVMIASPGLAPRLSAALVRADDSTLGG